MRKAGSTPNSSLFWGEKMVEYEKVIVLEAVYNNSDIQTDYFDRDARLKEWYVCDLEGKAVTEAKLRRALRQLPEWLQNLRWDFEKGEKYSMSDHYYGQLRMDENTGIPVKRLYGGESNVRFLLRVTYLSTFEMNQRKDEPLPQSLEELRRYVENRQREREIKEIQMREKIAEAHAKVIESSHAVIDGRGFHVLTPQEKTEEIVKLQQDLLKKKKEDQERIHLTEETVLCFRHPFNENECRNCTDPCPDERERRAEERSKITFYI